MTQDATPTEPDPNAEPSNTTPKSARMRGCVVAPLVCLALLIAAVVGVKVYRDHQAAERLRAHKESVQNELGPLVQKASNPDTVHVSSAVEPLRAKPSKHPYDLDKTVRVIHEIDHAIQEHKDLKSYLIALSKQDYRNVAPEILEARGKILDIVLEMHAQHVELQDQEAAWNITGEMLLTVFSAVQVDSGSGGLPGAIASGKFSVDQKKFDQALQDLRARHEERAEVLRNLRTYEQKLLKSLLEYSRVYSKYLNEWDALCVHRDRATLAVQAGDWDAALNATQKAINLAPYETEAHLQRARALIESSRLAEGETARNEARTILSKLVDNNPEVAAPALLLRGVLHTQAGQPAKAKLDFQQSAAQFPKQAERLKSVLDPYASRQFLRKSREGNSILRHYKSTVLGAGYFSPDLQLARVLFDQGKHEEGRQKILDHFSRRRAQKQWDLVLSDLTFCEQFLTPGWHTVFPEESYLDLELSKSLMGSKLTASVVNRSSRTLRNASLVLVVRFTDMHRDDYETFISPTSAPSILGHETTKFGDIEVRARVLGVEKTTEDIVQHRAILITDEAVSWVDTNEFKVADARERTKERATHSKKNPKPDTAPPKSEKFAWLKPFGVDPNAFENDLTSESNLAVDYELGKDSVKIKLPPKLALLRPFFRLVHGDKVIAPSVNRLEDNSIDLVFNAVENFENATTQKPIVLRIDGLLGQYELVWNPDEKGSYALSPELR